ncbi:unnamed protein product [Rotaria sp. Silwood2]|nr:unnamed protein product [Rotaria sp. Silwood2]CAF3160401.1 unnamed protein product [Rotaria sp. Silwood2]CAF3936508.1 unnamed protein product [Rotaria sp. Silwood2]CAF4251521.1 unnamed protein product [Rotaria sp. Silwood2]
MIVHEQWVQLIEYCSYKCNYSETVTKGIGVEKLCQATDVNFGEKDKINNGWILSNNNREEYVIVSFQTPVFINEIHVYESLNPGSIVKLEVLESQRNKWWIMWQQKSHRDKKILSQNIFKSILRRYRFQSNTIRITLDPRYTDQIGIQAIKLIGSNIFDINLHHITLSQAMMNLYEQTLNNTQLDVQFIIDNKILNAHRNILCCRCSYFHALLLDDFNEKSQIKPIELTDIDYETFIELLFFIYNGIYHKNLSYDIAIKCMIYSNKINFLTGKNAALEKICYYLCLNHNLILSMYYFIKKLSPTFDLLLDYIYELCSQNMNEICKQKEFSELDKDLLIELICQSAQRREIREQEKNNQATL